MQKHENINDWTQKQVKAIERDLSKITLSVKRRGKVKKERNK